MSSSFRRTYPSPGPTMKHLYSSNRSYSLHKQRDNYKCDSRSNGTTMTVVNPSVSTVINHLLSTVDTIDSAAVVDYSTIQRFIRLIDSGRVSAADLGRAEVMEALKRTISREIERFNARKSFGNRRFGSTNKHHAANRVLLQLLLHLECELEVARVSNSGATLGNVRSEGDIEQPAEGKSTSHCSSAGRDRRTTALLSSTSPEDLSEDSDFDSGDSMGKRKNRKKKTTAKQFGELPKIKVEHAEDGGDQCSWADACGTPPETEDASGAAADELVKIIDKWQIGGDDEESFGGDEQRSMRQDYRNHYGSSQDQNAYPRHYPHQYNSYHSRRFGRHSHEFYYQSSEPRRILNFMTHNAAPHFPGGNEYKMNQICARSGYCLELSNGQRKYGPPPSHVDYNFDGPAPNSEIFVGRIPKEVFEDELIPLFETVGKIYDLRLMIDPMSGYSRGYAFITYFNKEDAAAAVEKLNDFEIRRCKPVKVKISIPNVRLFIGNIPKHVFKEDIFEEFQKLTVGLVDVIVYQDPIERKRNRGFCFLEFETHKLASQAKRKLITNRVKVWNIEILVDWAEPLEEPDEETMSKVKVLYVRNLSLTMQEETVKTIFDDYGPVERVKKIKDYAFVHFDRRETALRVMEEMQGKELVEGSGQFLEISLAKPPSDKKRKEEILRNRERRLMNMMNTKYMYSENRNNYSGPQLGPCPGPSSHASAEPEVVPCAETPVPVLVPVAPPVQATVVPPPPPPPPPNGVGPNASPFQIAAAAAAAAAAFVAGGGPPPHPCAGVHLHPHSHHASGPALAALPGGSHIMSATLTGPSGQFPTQPSPSAVARVTVGAGNPPPPPPPFLLPIHNGAHNHAHGHHYHHVSVPCSSTSVAASAPSTTCTHADGSSCGNSMLTQAKPCGTGNMQPWNWYNWYEPNWWYAASCAASVNPSFGGTVSAPPPPPSGTTTFMQQHQWPDGSFVEVNAGINYQPGAQATVHPIAPLTAPQQQSQPQQQHPPVATHPPAPEPQKPVAPLTLASVVAGTNMKTPSEIPAPKTKTTDSGASAVPRTMAQIAAAGAAKQAQQQQQALEPEPASSTNSKKSPVDTAKKSNFITLKRMGAPAKAL